MCDAPDNAGKFLAFLKPLSQDGELVPYGMDETSKPRLEVTGTKYLFSINDPQQDDAGFYQVDVGEANMLSTDFKGNRSRCLFFEDKQQHAWFYSQIELF